MNAAKMYCLELDATAVQSIFIVYLTGYNLQVASS